MTVLFNMGKFIYIKDINLMKWMKFYKFNICLISTINYKNMRLIKFFNKFNLIFKRFFFKILFI